MFCIIKTYSLFSLNAFLQSFPTIYENILHRIFFLGKLFQTIVIICANNLPLRFFSTKKMRFSSLLSLAVNCLEKRSKHKNCNQTRRERKQKFRWGGPSLLSASSFPMVSFQILKVVFRRRGKSFSSHFCVQFCSTCLLKSADQSQIAKLR